jgi:hypothetical protein
VEGQVHGPEELLKLPGWFGIAAHQARLPNLLSIVNPDASHAGDHIITAADPFPTTSMEPSTASIPIRVSTN